MLGLAPEARSVVDINALRALAPPRLRPRAQAITPTAPHAAPRWSRRHSVWCARCALVTLRAGGLIPIARQYPGAREFVGQVAARRMSCPKMLPKDSLALRSRHLPRDNLPVSFLVDRNHRSAKVDRTERLSAERPFEGEQHVNDRRIAIHMYRLLSDVN